MTVYEYATTGDDERDSDMIWTTTAHPAHTDCGACHRSESHDGLERFTGDHWEPAGTIARWAAEDAAPEAIIGCAA